MIKLTGVSLQRGIKQLFTGADMTVFSGDKIGLIGANGTGKSSLFKLLTAELALDGGSLDIPKQWQIAHMAQEVEAGEATCLEYVLAGDAPLCALEAQLATTEDGETLANLYHEYELLDGYSARARATQLLHGLGFEGDAPERPVSSFSGGWRIRLNLAQALMCRSDLLLLDEPTNHLDLDATLWLEKKLKDYAGTLLIISHDRDFLDNVVTRIAHLENGKLIHYSGNYSAFERQKAERLAQQQAAFEKQQTRVAEIEDFVRRFRAKATKAKQAQSRLKELERMEQLSPAHVDSPFTFRFLPPERIPQQLLTFDAVSLGFGETALLENLAFSLHGNSRLGLLGANGAGKSTLMKALAGVSPLMAGTRIEGAHLAIGYFNQHQLEALDLQASCYLHLQRLTPAASEQSIRNFLGGFDFMGDRVFEAITHFSGGEKARLALAILAWQKPNLLLLDEPTNHLDLEVRHALTLALQAYEGAMVVVSHDRHLLRNTVDEFWLVEAGRVEPYDGDLHDYEARIAATPAAKTPKAGKPQKASATPKNSGDNANREQIKTLSQSLKKVEKSLEQAQVALARVDQQLADPSLYLAGNAAAAPLLKEQAKWQAEVQRCEEEWLVLSDNLDSLAGTRA
jgi:ATP-binding cassette, subfamily F, member 3